MNITDQSSELKNVIPSSHFEDTIDISKILGHLYQYKWIIIFSSICAFIIAFLHTFTIQPQYKTSALLQISTQSGNNILNTLGLKSNQSSSTETELALIRTRYILEPVIRENRLNIKVMPHYFPVFGNWMARHHDDPKLAKPFLGLHAYAWGGEKIRVKYFSVPPEYEGQSFRLVVGKHNTYQVYFQNDLIMTGKMGERSISHHYPGILLELITLKARPGTEFILSFQSPLKLVNQVSHQLKINKLASETNSGMVQAAGLIQLELSGPDPEQVERILNAIINYAVTKNVQLKSREAQKTLNFLYEHLPELKKDLEHVENALNQYHAKTGTFSMATASQLLTNQLNNVMFSLEALKVQKEELLQIYTPRYLQVIANEHQQARLEKKLREIKKKITNFPAIKQEEINLIRDVKIKNKMYEALLSEMHQLEIVKAGLVGDIIALDNAAPAALMPSHKLMILLTGFFIGMFLSSFAIIIKTMLTRTIDDIDQLENEVQIPVKAIIPFSKKQKKLERMSKKGIDVPGNIFPLPLILAQHDPKDISVESLQSLRISLYITNSSATNKVTAIMGSLSGIGKSFVSLNLAHILADSGKRTLLIDADIRKGRLHRALFQSKKNGLSEYLAEEVSFEDLVRYIQGNLFFIPSGGHTRHPIELLKNPRFCDLIQRTKNEFDQIIIDTPPVLPVIDAILITRYCDTRLFVVGGLSDQLEDVKQAVKKVRAHGIDIDGIIFNHRTPMARYGSKYAYYRYAYGS
ncbi:MAG TPA: polysaccharide biosynthesis tyrosine autokinase [Gammaproteobacteria bacterium]|nr:polysaccharide biosynthesis tyrosine autokinase [Gammaproteobacteria bacterium]